MNNKIITIDFLKKHHICENGIDFFKRNFPEKLFPKGLDLSKVKIKNDYLNYFITLNYYLKCTYKYDSNENCIEKISPNNTVWEYKYNEHNNLIEEKYPNGKIDKYVFKYDSIGILIQVGECDIKYLD